jgi:tetratricopeptide (TPR) repeat protein
MRFVLALALFAQDPAIQDLSHFNPVIRRNACVTLAEKGIKASIEPLVGLLEREPDEAVRAAAVDALEKLTGVKGNGPDYKKWKSWWDTEGRKSFPIESLTREQIRPVVQEALREADRKLQDFEKVVESAKNEIRILTITVAVIAVVFVLVMIYFVGHVSSKLKEWRELVKQAEFYIKESEQVTKRTDRVLEELEAKKSDILEFVKKLKEEKEAEIERYADLLQQNTEHRMREEVMGLRQKAEKELEETLGQLRQQIDVEVRRLGSEQKEKVDRDFKAQNDRFMKEVDAHTLFLQASFAQSHGKPEEALKIYKKLLALKPDHQVGWERMGTVYRELMRYEEALEAYQKAIELDPNDPTCCYNVAATYARQRKRDKMLEALSLAIKNDGEFKDEALNDPAFRDYWNDPAFKDLAEA